MTIETIKSSRLRNEEHFQFHTEFKLLIEQYTALTLNVEEVFANYLVQYNNEDLALDLIRRNEITNRLALADDNRDFAFTGFYKTVEASSMHFDETIRLAAEKLLVYLDAQGDVPGKTYDEETASFDQIDQALTNEYADSVATLSLSPYQAKLQELNTIFKDLMKERYTSDANKTPLRMRDVRKVVDADYREVIKRIEAIICLNGTDGYVDFINELNERISRYNIIIAQREGRHSKTKESKKTTAS